MVASLSARFVTVAVFRVVVEPGARGSQSRSDLRAAGGLGDQPSPEQAICHRTVKDQWL